MTSVMFNHFGKMTCSYSQPALIFPVRLTLNVLRVAELISSQLTCVTWAIRVSVCIQCQCPTGDNDHFAIDDNRIVSVDTNGQTPFKDFN